MPKRRNYSAEFKREAVALANQPGVTRAQIGRELDINPNMITRWQRELTANGSKAFLGQGVARDEEMAGLKREVNRRLLNLFRTRNHRHRTHDLMLRRSNMPDYQAQPRDYPQELPTRIIRPRSRT